MASGQFRVLRSSAGSGKTYALVRHYLELALATPDAAAYRGILAITFTNAAAAEMKERILRSLRGFSGGSGDPDFHQSLFTDICQSLRLTGDELTSRAGAAYTHMLHQYGQVSVSTMDSFMHKLVRQFAHELRLRGDFSIEISSTRFLDEVVDQCIEMAGLDDGLTLYLGDFIETELDDESDWNIRTRLGNFAKNLLNEDARARLVDLEKLKLEDFNRIRKEITVFCLQFEQELSTRSEKLSAEMKEHHIEPEDFSRKIVPSFLKKLRNQDFSAPVKTLLDGLANGQFYTKSAKADVRERMDRFFPRLSGELQELIDLISGDRIRRYVVSKLVLGNLSSLGLMVVLEKLGQAWREENNTILIADFHRMVSTVVSDNPAPFIYERAGERYRHILIDEFQDTSELQWKNFLPLLENSLSTGHSGLIVGDAKQAIYRWRNGNVEQFIQLPDTGNRQNPLLRAAFVPENLVQNYRSARAVVEFNNALFAGLKGMLNKFATVYTESSQDHVREAPGWVQVNRVTGENTPERRKATHQQILTTIRQCLEDGFELHHMAVLMRRVNEEIVPLSSFLIENGIQVETEKSLLLIHSHQVQALLSVLRYWNAPEDPQTGILLVKTLSFLPTVTTSESELFAEYLKGEGRNLHSDVDAFLSRFAPGLVLEKPSSHTVYSLCAHGAAVLGLEPDRFLESLFAEIHSRRSIHRDNLSLFLEWFDEKSDGLYAVGGTSKALKIMTIHQSKGLQFPVVIYPRIAAKKPNSDIWIDAHVAHPELPHALVRFSGSKEHAPPEFETEKELQTVDDLNIVYVATTRAEDRLYLIHELKKVSDKDEHENNMDTAIGIVFERTFGFSRDSTEWSVGTREPCTIRDEAQKPDLQPGERSPIFQLLQTSHQAEAVTGVLRTAALRLGRLIHLVLSTVKEDGTMKIPAEVGEAEERETLTKQARGIVEDPVMARWFTRYDRVYAEAELLTPQGKILRPDRVVKYADRIEVVDFKTGAPFVHHADQVREYVDVIRSMEELPVKGFLAYLSNLTVQEVI